jgi:hypothetical protein
MENVDNIVAALRHHNDRVCEIDLEPLPHSALEKITPMMQESLPTLTHLNLTLRSKVDSTTVLPDSFLGGCAPRLRELVLQGIPFPGLPKLLLSANNLVELYLGNIPHSGYISPEAMVTSLSPLINLRILVLHFKSRQSRPNNLNQSLASFTRIDLPALVDFRFCGTHDYLEEFLARINTPLLHGYQVIILEI